MKKAIAASVLCLALAAPAAADSICVCQKFAKQFKKRESAEHVYWSEMIRRGTSVRARKKVRRGIYDYASNGYIGDSWCKTYPEHCRALKACLLAGGATYGKDIADGKSKETATKDAAYSCAVAAAGIYLIA